MLKASGLAFCCYDVTGMARARIFYEGVLGLKPTTVSYNPNGQWLDHGFGPHALAIGSVHATERI